MKIYNPEKTDEYIEVPASMTDIEKLIDEKYSYPIILEKDN